MRNLVVLNETKITDTSIRDDAISLTSNPFLKELYVLYRNGLVIGVKKETHEVRLDDSPSPYRYFLNGTSQSCFEILFSLNNTFNTYFIWRKWRICYV